MKREYYLDPDIRKIMLIPAFAIIGMRELYNFVNLFWRDDGMNIGKYLIFSLTFVYGIYMIIAAYTEKLVVSPDGISFERMGLFIFVKWADMDHIGFRRVLRISYEGIFVPREKVVLKGFESFWVFGKEITINLFNYSDDWRNSELGEQIKQYAPHLFTS